MRFWSRAAAVLAACVVVGAVLPDDEPPAPAAAPDVTASTSAAPPRAPSRSPEAAAPPQSAPPPPPEAAAPPRPRQTRVPLLMPADGGDGDSWRDTDGNEYRLGMVNTPEVGECFAAEATAERKALVASGFRAAVYAQDRYGRGVSVVTSADGRNVNVHLARYGFADDRYLAQFRHENPSLADQLDAAFAAARAERRGLWGRCTQPQAVAEPAPPPPAASDGCHPDYATCIPVQGDGSGRGAANDLDCGDLEGAVRLRQAGVDPYRLDADGDGVGCDS